MGETNNNDQPLVSIIVPTMATAERAVSLQRAIDSIRTSSTKPVMVIPVVNGQRFSPGVCAWLKGQTDLHYIQIEEGSLPLALLEGRLRVQTEYFGFLDDDDEYLPGTLDAKIDALMAHPNLDIVISNGYRQSQGIQSVFHPDIGGVIKDPLGTLFERNWLASCGGLFRTRSATVHFFENPHPYAEWTWLAFRLCMAQKKLGAIDIPGFRIHDTPGSLSKTTAYQQSYFSLFERMLQAKPPHRIASRIRNYVSAAYHQVSEDELRRGNRFGAFKAHLRSIMSSPRGLRYLSYTRHLLRKVNTNSTR